jgi:hypothetical protein
LRIRESLLRSRLRSFELRSLKRVRPLEFMEELALLSLVDADERDVSPLIEEFFDLCLLVFPLVIFQSSELVPRFTLPAASVPLEL